MGRIGTIVNRKAKQDSKRAGMFTKLTRSIIVAVKEGGPDPEYNASLQNAIDKAKAANMPNDNIERAIKKGSGDGSDEDYFEVSYEGYGPGGVAVLVECLTDNINRTAGDVRAAFTKARGNLGTTGSAGYLFDHLGVLVVEAENSIDEDALMMEALEAGAEDFVAEEGQYEIYTAVSDFAQVRNALVAKGYPLAMAELTYLPKTLQRIDESDIKDMRKLLDTLEDNDDVQNVYSTWEDHHSSQ
jgi:YebC/PmpR family DNA-binding regulatory protein